MSKRHQPTAIVFALVSFALAACTSPTELPPTPLPEPTAEVAPPTVDPAAAAGGGATTLTTLIQPQDVTIDTQGLPYSWEANLVAATPYDNSQPPGPMGLPEHIEINFEASDPATAPSPTPIMYIIPVDAYEQLWDEAGDPMVTTTISQIYTLTVAINIPAPTSGMPALPPEGVGGGYNDVAVQVGRAAADPDSASKSGYRFVGRWAQDANAVTNQGLRYVYQGFTNNGRYLVAFFYPVTTAQLPADYSALSADEQEKFNADAQGYIQAQVHMLNALPTSDWVPDLATLDSLVASLRIAGMPATGLHDAVWEWTGSSYEGTDTPVADPALFTVTYAPDGSLSVQADCNSASGSYTFDGGSVGGVRVTMGPATLAECGPESRSEELINSVTAAQDYRVPPGGGALQLNMPAGGPVLMFQAAGMDDAAVR